jgi:hypothetical protein
MLTGDMPVPLTGTLCGLLLAFVVITTDPLTAPPAVGVKVTPTLHVAPAANEPGFPQVVEGSMTKPPAGGTIEVIERAVVCQFLRVKVWIRLVRPIAWLPKLRPDGETVVGAIPAPVSGIVTGVTLCVVVTPRVEAGAAPKAPGVNFNSILHEE